MNITRLRKPDIDPRKLPNTPKLEDDYGFHLLQLLFFSIECLNSRFMIYHDRGIGDLSKNRPFNSLTDHRRTYK
jgi:hypothetical protein